MEPSQFLHSEYFFPILLNITTCIIDTDSKQSHEKDLLLKVKKKIKKYDHNKKIKSKIINFAKTNICLRICETFHCALYSSSVTIVMEI